VLLPQALTEMPVSRSDSTVSSALPTGRQRLDPVGLCDDGDVVDLDGVVFREIFCDRERGLLLCRFVGDEVEDRLHISIGRPAGKRLSLQAKRSV